VDWFSPPATRWFLKGSTTALCSIVNQLGQHRINRTSKTRTILPSSRSVKTHEYPMYLSILQQNQSGKNAL